MESYEKIKKVLALGFMNFLDDNKSKGKMCLSNGECEDIEKAFNEQDWPRLAGYLDKYTESEDERIRKTIVATIEQCPDDFLNPKNRDKMLAYLERQKEQPISAEEVLARAGLKPYKDGNQWCILAGDNIQEGICGFGDTIEDALYEFLKEVLDLQKEQKPAEKQDYSGLNDLERAIHRGFLCAGVENVPVGIIKDTASECMAFLALIEPKPAEWSEEDADILNCCISSIEEAKENRYAYKETDGDTSYDREIDWLKSLRPSWKPSEEQMALLRAVISDPNNAGAESCQLVLREIYQQFKKL